MHGFLFHILELESLRSVALGMSCSHFGGMEIYGFFKGKIILPLLFLSKAKERSQKQAY